MCSVDVLQSSFMHSSLSVLPVFRELPVFMVIYTEKQMQIYINHRAAGLHILKLSILRNYSKFRPYHQDLKYNPHPGLAVATQLVVLLFPGNCF